MELKAPGNIQLTCPYCKHEFPFDNGWIDAELSATIKKWQDATRELRMLRAKPYSVQKKNEGRIKTLGLEIQDMQMRITAIKKVRKLKDQQLTLYAYHIFKGVVIEEVGQKRYEELMQKTLDELEAYKLSGLMWHEYTISKSKKSVTSINKL